ncbi:hypothetical protein QUB33_24300 [Microcoleus sp. B3-A4]|uniref:hypothetical protein n=1 Tax=Microcoleus sp. B3-A4 TaxID=2818653 RepID=UPI002FD63718
MSEFFFRVAAQRAAASTLPKILLLRNIALTKKGVSSLAHKRATFLCETIAVEFFHVK